MVESAQHWHGPHWPPSLRSTRVHRSWIGAPPLQALVWPGGVAVGHVLAQHTAQVGLAQDQEVIEARAPDTAQEPLAGSVLPGRAVGRAQLRAADRGGDACEGRTILAVAVADGVAGALAEGRGLAQLLGVGCQLELLPVIIRIAGRRISVTP